MKNDKHICIYCIKSSNNPNEVDAIITSYPHFTYEETETGDKLTFFKTVHYGYNWYLFMKQKPKTLSSRGYPPKK